VPIGAGVSRAGACASAVLAAVAAMSTAPMTVMTLT
jgi:hypothetical protein